MPENLDAFFVRALTVPVVWTSVQTRGYFDDSHEERDFAGRGPVLTRSISVLCRTDRVGAARTGDPITVDGAVYRVRESPRREGDGKLCRVFLEIV